MGYLRLFNKLPEVIDSGKSVANKIMSAISKTIEKVLKCVSDLCRTDLYFLNGTVYLVAMSL
jgi:hypothetical protein